MDLFLVNGGGNSKTPTSLLIFAGIGVVSIYAISKFFSSFLEVDQEQEDDQNHRDNKPAGIYNQGNTCFVNSLLQALSSLETFQNLLKDTAANFRGNLSPNEQFIIELASVIDQINNASESISVSRLLTLIDQVKEGLINLQQQDAHELYAAIISCVDSALNKQKSIDLSASARLIQEKEQEKEFENPLIGYLKSSTVCTTCKTETSVKIDPFYDLSLDISKVYVTDIKSALAQFQREEKIQHWTCSNCSIINHCRKLRRAITMLRGKNKEKLEFIGGAIIDFLESENLEEHQIKEVNFKLQNLVKEFTKEYESMEDDPERDTIFIEMEGQQSSIFKKTVITKYPKILVIHLKQLVVHPYTGDIVLLKKHIGFDETLEIPAKNRKRSFTLTGLLTHIGNESFGHYMSFRRANRKSGQWYVMNDSMSQKTTWPSVQQSRAYMLFYEAN